jgi:hypothetical protein
MSGVDFRGSVDLVLPEGALWDASGKTWEIMTLQKYIFVL